MSSPMRPRRGEPEWVAAGGPGLPAPPRRSPLRTVALVLLPFVVSGTAAVGAYFFPVAQVALQQTGQQLSSTAAQPVAAGSPFTVLLLGSDDDAKFQGMPLTQSMIPVRVDPA